MNRTNRTSKLSTYDAWLYSEKGKAGIQKQPELDWKHVASLPDHQIIDGLDKLIKSHTTTVSHGLPFAIHAEKTGLLKELIQRSADVESLTQNGTSVLWECLRAKDVLTKLTMLLKAGANPNQANGDPNIAYETPGPKTFGSMYSGSERIAENKGLKPVVGAAVIRTGRQRDIPALIEVLCDHGAKITEEDLIYMLSAMAREGDLRAFSYVLHELPKKFAISLDINAGNGWDRHSPLTAALEFEHPSLAIELLKAGANPSILDWDGRSPLTLFVDKALKLVKDTQNSVEAGAIVNEKQAYLQLLEALAARGQEESLSKQIQTDPLFSKSSTSDQSGVTWLRKELAS
jgi:hypothetical protein